MFSTEVLWISLASEKHQQATMLQLKREREREREREDTRVRARTHTHTHTRTSHRKKWALSPLMLSALSFIFL